LYFYKFKIKKPLRYFIELAYNGTRYHGWQMQKTGISVEEVLENCLSQLLKTPIDLIGAGRTDSGVHARQFFAHFDYAESLNQNLIQRLNAFLPYDIKIYKIYPVASRAHARFSALERSYCYFISLGKHPFFKEFSWQWLSTPLDMEAMNQAARILKNYRDFSNFCKTHANNKTGLCKIEYAQWKYENDLLYFKITADRFLRNMVRAIVGTLIEVGKRKIYLQEFRKIIEAKNRQKAGTSAPAKGLFLTSIRYPKSLFL